MWAFKVFVVNTRRSQQKVKNFSFMRYILKTFELTRVKIFVYFCTRTYFYCIHINFSKHLRLDYLFYTTFH